LPFYHSVEAIKAALGGNIGDVLPHLAVVASYTVVIFALAVVFFQRKMNGDKI
jgi:ABC-2 type transport system permease protein